MFTLFVVLSEKRDFCIEKQRNIAMKRIVISDESINSYGFWVKTDGIDLEAFSRNPVMLYNHNRWGGGTVHDQLPIGKWKDLRIENGVLTGEPVFDENDEFAVKIKQKYEAGILNACSMGFKPLEWSSEPALLKEGQTTATVVKCCLLEISICDIPSNSNATVVLYNDNSEIINLSDLPNLVIGPKINNSNMKEIALKLGLAETADSQSCVNAIQKKDDKIATLTNENASLKLKLKTFEEAEATAKKNEVESLLSEAIQKGRIDAKMKPNYEKLFELDHEGTKAVLASLPDRKPMEAAPSGTEDGNLCKMSWYELDKADRLYELKTKFPEIYKQKYEEKFNKKH